MYVFLDIETTGLDPHRDRILQLAIQVTDANLRELGDPFCQDVALDEVAAGRLHMNPYVRDMHRATGLLERLEADVTARGGGGGGGGGGARVSSAYDVELAALDYLHRIDSVEPKLTIAGNSVHFDLAFLREHMPVLAGRFSHRIMDVSVLRMFESTYGSGAIDVDNTREHDALADVQCSIAQLHAYVARRQSFGGR